MPEEENLIKYHEVPGEIFARAHEQGHLEGGPVRESTPKYRPRNSEKPPIIDPSDYIINDGHIAAQGHEDLIKILVSEFTQEPPEEDSDPEEWTDEERTLELAKLKVQEGEDLNAKEILTFRTKFADFLIDQGHDDLINPETLNPHDDTVAKLRQLKKK